MEGGGEQILDLLRSGQTAEYHMVGERVQTLQQLGERENITKALNNFIKAP